MFASRIGLSVVRQALRNNCETASLSMLLATTGRRVGQLRLQSEVARSGPLDPRGRGGDRIWGDPELGFVGRAEGGGAAGGFGVYQRPIRQLAARYGRPVVDMTRRPRVALVRRLLAGHAVLVWVGLSDGPYDSWRSPQGRRVTVNYGEHAVVLTGVHANGDLRVANPLHGTRERWSPAQFARMWRRLGRRAASAT